MSVSVVYHVNRLDAFSTETGITMSSQAFVDIPKMCVSVCYDEEDNLKTTVYRESIKIVEKDYFKKNPSRKDDQNFYSGIVCILVVLLYCIIGALVRTKTFTTILVFSLISICASNALVNFAVYVANIVYMAKHPSLSRFHSAEHMAVISFRKKEKMPSMEEIKQTSRFDVGCSQVESILVPFVTSLINSIILTVMISLIHFNLIQTLDGMGDTRGFAFIVPIFAFYYIMNEKLLLRVGSYVKKAFEHESIVKLFQWPLLLKPTERELILAEEALRQRELMDQEIMANPSDYTTESVCFNPKENKTLYILENGQRLHTTIDEYIDWIESYKKADVVEPDTGNDKSNT